MKIIKYDINDFKGIKNLDGFYKQLGLFDDLLAKKYNVMDVYMERENCEMLKDFMVANFNNKKTRLRPKYIASSVGMHWMNLSPSSILDVPKDEIWVDENKELKNGGRS